MVISQTSSCLPTALRNSGARLATTTFRQLHLRLSTLQALRQYSSAPGPNIEHLVRRQTLQVAVALVSGLLGLDQQWYESWGLLGLVPPSRPCSVGLVFYRRDLKERLRSHSKTFWTEKLRSPPESVDSHQGQVVVGCSGCAAVHQADAVEAAARAAAEAVPDLEVVMAAWAGKECGTSKPLVSALARGDRSQTCASSDWARWVVPALHRACSRLRACTGAYFDLSNAVSKTGAPRDFVHFPDELTSGQLHREPVWLQVMHLDEGHELRGIHLTGLDVLSEDEALQGAVRNSDEERRCSSGWRLEGAPFRPR